MSHWIEDRVHALMDEAEAKIKRDRELDLVEFAMRLPMEVICRLLGISVADRETVSGWATEAVRVFELQDLDPEGPLRLNCSAS